MGEVFKEDSLLLLGIFCYVFVFYFFAAFLKLHCMEQHTRPLILKVCNRLVAAIHGVVCFVVGLLIMKGTSYNIIEGTETLTTDFAFFALGYVIYDVWAMWYVHYQNYSCQFKQHSYWTATAHFLLNRPVNCIHHLSILLVCYPMILWWRNDRGDFFVGCFYASQISTVFVSLRVIASELMGKLSIVKMITNSLSVLTVFVCQVLLLPYLFIQYANYSGMSTSATFSTLPVRCFYYSAVIFAFQLMKFTEEVIALVRSVLGGTKIGQNDNKLTI